MTSFEGFKKQLLELEPGERLSYHIGNLAKDRGTLPTVNKVAILAKGLELMGRVTLASQRLDRSKFAYYIILCVATGRRLQAVELTRAWTLGQENLSTV